MLWIFRQGEAPPLQELLSGISSKKELVRLRCGGELLTSHPPRNDVLTVRYKNSGSAISETVPILTVESESAIENWPIR